MRCSAVLLHLVVGLVTSARSAPQHHAAGGANPSDDAVAASLRTQNFVHIPGPNPILTVGVFNFSVVQPCLRWTTEKLNTVQRWTTEKLNFIRIQTGPNPILTVGENGTWDSSVIECAGGVYSEYDSACTAAPATRRGTLALKPFT
eukprot:SAG31_NODE_12228_length_957_cov_1.266900_1_plen_146_part_00